MVANDTEAIVVNVEVYYDAVVNKKTHFSVIYSKTEMLLANLLGARNNTNMLCKRGTKSGFFFQTESEN